MVQHVTGYPIFPGYLNFDILHEYPRIGESWYRNKTNFIVLVIVLFLYENDQGYI